MGRSMSVPASAKRCAVLRPISASSATSPMRATLGQTTCILSPQVPSVATIAVSPRQLVADAPYHHQCLTSSSAYCPYCQAMGLAAVNSPAHINSPISSPMVPAPPLSPRQLAGEPSHPQYCHAHSPRMLGTYSQIAAASQSPVKSITLPARPCWAPLQVPRPSSLQSTPLRGIEVPVQSRYAEHLPQPAA